MTPQPPRPGSSPSDAEKTMTDPPTPHDPAATAAPPPRFGRATVGPPAGGPPPGPRAATPPAAHAYGPPAAAAAFPGTPPAPAPTAGAPHGAAPGTAPSAERTITDVLEPETGGALTLADRADQPPPPAETTTPPLIPDAIIPPGMAPEPPDDPDLEPEMDGTRPTPRIEAGEPGPFPGPGMPPPGGVGPLAARRTLLIGGGALAALLLGGSGVLAYTTLSGGSPKHRTVASPTHVSPPPPTPSPASPTPAKTPEKPRPRPKPTPVDIRDEKKDPQPLSVTEVFPSGRIKVAGHTFVLMKTVPNDHCDLTANGPFSAELTRQHCRRVVRATFVSDDKKLAVTTGIAAMPTDAAAAAAMKAQDAPHYKWFRGMKATDAPKIDQGGGYAVSVQRGRYIIYAYAMYADAHKPKPGDKTLKDVADGFRDSTARPINKRAKDMKAG